MFTGLVEEIGTIKEIDSNTTSAKLRIKASKVLEDVELGDSICTNGVCLTVTEFDNDSFTVDVMPETMESSNLNELEIGSFVNLERALKLGDRLGGHIVSGHVDSVGIIESFDEIENAIIVTIKASKETLKYIINKGSISVDGASLTVQGIDDNSFKVSIIPLTQEDTILTKMNVGDKVNLEVDMIGKYIEKMLGLKEEQVEKGISKDFLKENGFM